MIVEDIKWTCSCGRRNLLRNRDVGRAYYRPTDIAREYGQGEILPQDLTTHLVCRCGMLWKKQRVRSYTVRWGKKEYARYVRYRAAWLGLIRWALKVAAAYSERNERYVRCQGIDWGQPVTYDKVPAEWQGAVGPGDVVERVEVTRDSRLVYTLGSMFPAGREIGQSRLLLTVRPAGGWARQQVEVPSSVTRSAEERLAQAVIDVSRRRRW